MAITKFTESVTAVLKRTLVFMPIQLNEPDFGTSGPPGSREGFGEVVHPSRECLQAASSEHETSRSQGTQGPIPGYHPLGPCCNGSVALAVTEQSEEQHHCTFPNIPTPSLHLSASSADGEAMIDVELEQILLKVLPGGQMCVWEI
ncbi:hypothetical protein B0H14DRAFT_2578163 [Mycena olivaceomarginata]|nr:hypothetical protein B0H14DRAFT_2578163 [Mycena olivaceomarginata]